MGSLTTPDTCLGHQSAACMESVCEAAEMDSCLYYFYPYWQSWSLKHKTHVAYLIIVYNNWRLFLFQVPI